MAVGSSSVQADSALGPHSGDHGLGFGYQYAGHGPIAPTINGSTLTMTLRQALETGKVNRVPVIAGTDRDESLIALPTTPSQYQAAVVAQYGKFAPQVLALHPLSRFYSPFVAFRTVASTGTRSMTGMPRLRSSSPRTSRTAPTTWRRGS